MISICFAIGPADSGVPVPTGLFKYYPFGANKQDDTQAQIWVLLNRDLLRELPLVGYRFASHYP